jgi:hypothetical protein
MGAVASAASWALSPEVADTREKLNAPERIRTSDLRFRRRCLYRAAIPAPTGNYLQTAYLLEGHKGPRADMRGRISFPPGSHPEHAVSLVLVNAWMRATRSLFAATAADGCGRSSASGSSAPTGSSTKTSICTTARSACPSSSKQLDTTSADPPLSSRSHRGLIAPLDEVRHGGHKLAAKALRSLNRRHSLSRP